MKSHKHEDNKRNDGGTITVQVFDFHHQKFCPGSMTAKQAVHAAVATWPKGIRPVVHWSESQEGRKPHAHSDYVAVSHPFLCPNSPFTFLASPQHVLYLR